MPNNARASLETMRNVPVTARYSVYGVRERAAERGCCRINSSDRKAVSEFRDRVLLER